MQKRGWIAGLLTLLLVLWCAWAGAEEMTLTAPAKLHPFQSSKLTLTLPAAGKLTITVRDSYGEHKPLLRELPVRAGSVTVSYDATSYEGMPLKAGNCTFTAKLTTAAGKSYTTQTTVKMGTPADKLEYALPRSDTYYLEQKERWKVDCGATGGGPAVLELFADEAMTLPAAKLTRSFSGKSMFTFTWDGTVGKKRIQPGDYWCSVYLKAQPEQAITFTLHVEAGAPPEEALRVNSTLLPATDDPDELLEKFCEPLTVVDIDATAHQKIYAEPSERSTALGRVHGQSQGLQVFEVGKRFTRVGAWRHEDGAWIEGYVPTNVLKVVRPFEHYGIVVDKPNQELRVYEYGRLLGKMRISTGLMERSNLSRETRAGAFLTTDRMITFESHGAYYEYPIRIDGGNLLHQVGYVPPKDGGFAPQLATLSQKASAGCVRMDYRTDEEYNLNAYWVWTHIGWGVKVLVLDDESARVERMEELGIR